ncbi:MAG: hypothetical protein ACM3PS_04115, partial [Syntrophothermus sp.]
QPPGSEGADLSSIVGGPGVTALSLSDANTGGKLKYPFEGSYSLRVNSELSYNGANHSRNGNTVSQEIAAVLGTDGQVHVSFEYAAVMVKPLPHQHDTDELPYFRVRAINSSHNDDVVFDYSTYVGEAGKGWQNGVAFGKEGDVWQYIDWTKVDLVSSAEHPVQAGDKIRLEITAAGCALGGHPGYAYVDEVFDPYNPPIESGLSIQATGPATAAAGSDITYTFTYNNNTGSLVDLTAVINPPTNVTFTSVSDTTNCSGTAPVTCNFTGVASGGSGSFTVTGTIDPAAAGTNVVLDNYTVSATGFPPVAGPPLTIAVTAQTPFALTASGAASVKPGDQYIYTLNYTSTMAVSNATVDLTLPPHTTFVSSDKTCTSNAGVVTCDLGSINADSGGSFTITVQVDKLKKVGLPLTLASSAYSISAPGAETANGSVDASAEVLSPFADVPAGHPKLDYIQAIWAYGVTGGCSASPLKYCPDSFVTRAYAAVFIERGMGNFAPTPNPTGMFADVPYPGQEAFTPFIEQFYNDKISGGCSLSPLKYCPLNYVLRGQAAVFIERALGNFTPAPNPTGMFADVPYPGLGAYTPFIEQLYNDGITSGCKVVQGLRYYCPQDYINRGDMAVFVQRAFHLPLPD